MPNITIYLTDDEYLKFKSLPNERQQEARDNATNQILKVIKESKKVIENGVEVGKDGI